MSKAPTKLRFKAKLQRPVQSSGKDGAWAFLVLPKSVSEKLPRRGRTSVEGTLNGHPFQATLEPDGQLSHWLKVSKALCAASGVKPGDTVALELAPVAKEPEPKLPADLRTALAASPKAHAMWDATTTLARIDWIHWIESAKQSKTRKSRVEGACDRLASGKKRVCCFDPSGYYDKSLSAPEAEE
ncbi:MAG TPA: YdeI/OmpD-associated family protein [Gammaproteobacteria bacterium]|nr:YdeI/OmpD-associated family protein [Gammaproteobacteria bacterium]